MIQLTRTQLKCNKHNMPFYVDFKDFNKSFYKEINFHTFKVNFYKVDHNNLNRNFSLL